MKTALLSLSTLTLLAVCGLGQAEIYRWVDENGKVHFSDSPHPSNEAEAMTLEPATKIGTVKPQSADHLFQQDYQKNKQQQQQRAEQAKQRKKEKQALREACDKAKEDLALAKSRRAGATSTSSKRYYNEQIENAKDREEEACKLSNFR